MSNFYLDNPSLKHHLHHPLVKRIVELKERNYTDKDTYDYAPVDFEDAMDSYEKVLEIAGEVIGEVVAPNAEEVDAQGPKMVNNRVIYAPGTVQNLEAATQAGLMGLSLPRRYNGLNFPMVAFIMASEMAARADAGFCNLWALQDCAETLYEFGDEAQRQKYLPRVCAGETMSMDLTEPDAGSDLQAVMLKATYDEKEDCWRLNGVKRFITNGDADIKLVLARSEEGTKDGRGLSYFVYDKQDNAVIVRRLENKMGIKGSPTCELVFKNAPAKLVGERRMGLIKYVMSLMNGARLGIGAQSVGIAEAAYREAHKYAQEREQFGKAIIRFPAVSEMLNNMRAKNDAARAILYETARCVDVYKLLQELAKEQPLTPEERTEMKHYNKIADALTPMLKLMSSEFCNQICYDAIQVHGGTGYMKDFPVERMYRDARITSIYEGTSQMQVVAAIRAVINGTYSSLIETFEQKEVPHEFETVKSQLITMSAYYKTALNTVSETNSDEILDLHARRLVEMAAYIIMTYLLMFDAMRYNNDDESLKKSLFHFLRYGKSICLGHLEYITCEI